jgi:hypothetical protein
VCRMVLHTLPAALRCLPRCADLVQAEWRRKIPRLRTDEDRRWAPVSDGEP